MPAKFGYWNIRGYGQPIRLLLAYTSTEVDEKRYNFVGAEHDPKEWMQEKVTFGFDFPNLPYYIDGDVKLTQTMAIMKYLGRQHGLIPRNETEKMRIDLIEAEALDMRMNWSFLCYRSNFDTDKVDYIKKVSLKLKEISAFLGNYPYFAGDQVTYIDFLMYELLDIHSILEPTILNDYPNLRDYHKRIQELPPIASYIKSDKFLSRPLNAAMAKWGAN